MWCVYVYTAGIVGRASRRHADDEFEAARYLHVCTAGCRTEYSAFAKRLESHKLAGLLSEEDL